MNKKGAELTIGTLVIIVLAIIVLVVIALGFGTGWGNFYSKMVAFFGGGVNIDTQVQACKLACNTMAKNDFCEYKRTVTATNEVFTVEGEKKKRITDTCQNLAKDYSAQGFESCPGLC